MVVYTRYTAWDFYAYKATATYVDVPSTVNSIGAWAFSGCAKLTSITIPNSVDYIGEKTFANCTSLTSIEIPSGVTSIGELAFFSCDSLYEVINNSELVLTLGSTDNGYVAHYAKVIVDKDGNKTYLDETSSFEYIDTLDGFRFIKENDQYVLIAYLGNEDTVTLPMNINGNEYSIDQMRGVKNVIIPEGVTSISDRAFLCLYVKNYTQEGLSIELGYTPEYIQMQHKKLLLFLQSYFKSEDERK